MLPPPLSSPIAGKPSLTCLLSVLQALGLAFFFVLLLLGTSHAIPGRDASQIQHSSSSIQANKSSGKLSLSLQVKRQEERRRQYLASLKRQEERRRQYLASLKRQEERRRQYLALLKERQEERRRQYEASQRKHHTILLSSSLPRAITERSYNALFSVTGGTPPYRFSISGGNLPASLFLNAKAGSISGTPTTVGIFPFAVSVSDSHGNSGKRQLSLVVSKPGSSSPGTIVLSPASKTVFSGGTVQFVATVHEIDNTTLKWSAAAGNISTSGLFIAPSVTNALSVIVKSTSVADPDVQATATVTVMPAPAPAPRPVSNTGIDNIYCDPGDRPTFGSSDGPANLPQRCINTALSSTPSPGKLLVTADNDLNSVLNKASCGDIISLQAGATFNGPITLPAKNCDQNHWITLRTSAPDSSLPAEGTRLTPCYAGISSLPGRPAYSCSSFLNVLAKIQIVKGAGAITVASGANYYRIIGIEVTRKVGTGSAFGLVTMTGADHLIFDRVWIHGTPLDETRRGIYLGDSTNVAVIDSYLNDFHCTASTGTCTDSQAINGGNSLLPTGPYKIVNNFLEAAAENILWGGAPGSTVPSDIEIRRNHMFKPMTWMAGDPNFIGTSFIVKNLFEIKNAERLLLEGNVMENSWGGFSQKGWGIVITPRGSWAATRDITIRYNAISHVGSGFQISATQDQESNGQYADSLADERLSIHDVTVDDMNAATYNGAGIGFMITSAFAVNPPLNNLTIDHVTILTDPNRILLVVGSDRRNRALPWNIVFTNNLAVAGKYSVLTTGGTYNGECAKSGQPLITFNQCWGSSYTFTNNVLVDYPPDQGPWPANNYLPKTISALNFTNFDDGRDGNYRLLPSAPYKNGGTDGKDIGADIDAIQTAILGVR